MQYFKKIKINAKKKKTHDEQNNNILNKGRIQHCFCMTHFILTLPQQQCVCGVHAHMCVCLGTMYLALVKQGTRTHVCHIHTYRYIDTVILCPYRLTTWMCVDFL